MVKEKPKIIYKKIQLIKYNRKKEEKNTINKTANYNNKNNINKAKYYNNKKKNIYINKPNDSNNNNNNKTVISSYNSNKLFFNQKSINEKYYLYNNQLKNKLINKIQNNKSQKNINETFVFSNRMNKVNEYNHINHNNKLNAEGKADNNIINNSGLIKYNTINILNNKNKSNKNNSLLKNCSNKNCLINENMLENKLIIKKLNKSYLMNLDKGKKLKKEIINKYKNIINASKYFKISEENENCNKSNEANRFISDYSLNKKEYINDYGKSNCYYIKNNLFIEELNGHNNRIRTKEGIKDYKIYNNYENPINNSNINEEQLNNIKKRRLELLKFLDFSSSIGTNLNNN